MIRSSTEIVGPGQQSGHRELAKRCQEYEAAGWRVHQIVPIGSSVSGNPMGPRYVEVQDSFVVVFHREVPDA